MTDATRDNGVSARAPSGFTVSTAPWLSTARTRPCRSNTRLAPLSSREWNRSCVNRQKKFGELLPVSRVRQSIHATRSRASVRDVVQHGGKRIGCAVVKESSREGEDRDERGRHEPVGPEGWSRVGPHLVERGRIERPHLAELANQLGVGEQTRARRRRIVDVAPRPLWTAVTRGAPGAGKQRATRDDRWILARHGRDGRPDAKLHECLDGVPCPHTADLELIPTRPGERNKWGDVRILCDAIGEHDESRAA